MIIIFYDCKENVLDKAAYSYTIIKTVIFWNIITICNKKNIF